MSTLRIAFASLLAIGAIVTGGVQAQHHAATTARAHVAALSAVPGESESCCD
jgi:hypothetical protein